MSAKKSGSRGGLYIVLISVHGLIRGREPELGRDADTGGQVTYVVELARALAALPDVWRVDLLTRQIFDAKVGTDYAQPVEAISENANIVRIPFGPRRYLRKETLWPYLDCFVDNTLKHFRSVGRLPDLIHTHYADAGYVGAHLSSLLGVPLMHTGHSLGRVKRERLREKGLDDQAIESRYNIGRRVEAEEAVLAAANLVLASTRQEVEEQYAMYEHYRPERMFVNPPGTDIERFHPPQRGERFDDLQAMLSRFLANPKKPIVLAISRPDERKNITSLVRAFGENRRLREMSNLVIVAGTRHDIVNMDKGSREVLNDVLLLIDYYDLYGQVAYPKHVDSEDVPRVYRLAASTRGVFINPALTEPFGLTLIEAASSGLPIVATHDGGPQDIVHFCKNGELIDPLDIPRMGEVLVEMLSDRERWKKLSDNGVKGARQYFSWRGHAENYVSHIKKLIGPRRSGRSTAELWRRLPFNDRALISDIDNTLIGDRASLRELLSVLKAHRDKVSFGVATGRRVELTLEALREWSVPVPDVMITSVGTEIYYGPNLTPDKGWAQHIDYRWEPERLRQLLDELPGLDLQPQVDQRRFKVSYFVDVGRAPPMDEIRGLLRKHDLYANVIFSHNAFLDLLPERATKGHAVRYFASKWGIPIEHVMVAGDSGNDEDMLRGSTLGVVVGNHSGELDHLRRYKRVFFAGRSYAGGIVEAFKHYDFLGRCNLPERSRREGDRNED
ncbi:MAG: HAD-IIB family hydrolase [Gammaproteobacteria bacterium]